MNEERARLILERAIHEDGGLFDRSWVLNWNTDSKFAELDGEFTPEQLEAIAFWMRLKGAAK